MEINESKTATEELIGNEANADDRDDEKISNVQSTESNTKSEDVDNGKNTQDKEDCSTKKTAKEQEDKDEELKKIMITPWNESRYVSENILVRKGKDYMRRSNFVPHIFNTSNVLDDTEFKGWKYGMLYTKFKELYDFKDPKYKCSDYISFINAFIFDCVVFRKITQCAKTHQQEQKCKIEKAAKNCIWDSLSDIQKEYRIRAALIEYKTGGHLRDLNWNPAEVLWQFGDNNIHASSQYLDYTYCYEFEMSMKLLERNRVYGTKFTPRVYLGHSYDSNAINFNCPFCKDCRFIIGFENRYQIFDSRSADWRFKAKDSRILHRYKYDCDEKRMNEYFGRCLKLSEKDNLMIGLFVIIVPLQCYLSYNYADDEDYDYPYWNGAWNDKLLDNEVIIMICVQKIVIVVIFQK